MCFIREYTYVITVLIVYSINVYCIKVIIALADKKRGHIPYRQSKLTHLIKDSLGNLLVIEY